VKAQYATLNSPCDLCSSTIYHLFLFIYFMLLRYVHTFLCICVLQLLCIGVPVLTFFRLLQLLLLTLDTIPPHAISHNTSFLYPTLLYSTLLYSTLLYSTFFFSIFYFSLFFSTLFFSTLHYFTPLTLPYMSL
jgi:hypothetical protein